MYASRRGPIEKVVVLSIHGYVSIYRRPATQPLGLRWGFETTSDGITHVLVISKIHTLTSNVN